MTKIMVVDDEPDLREMISIMMQKEGFETEMAEDGPDFLEKVDTFQPDIVMLDVVMPGLSTLEILERLKEEKSNPKIILYSVDRYSEEEQKIFEQGNVVDYIIEPVELDDFIDAVKKFVE